MSKPTRPSKSKNQTPATGTPGEILRRLFMEPLGITAYRLAKDLGAAPITISHILRGFRAISPEMAIKLGQYFGIAPQFWLQMENLHTLNRVLAESDSQVPRCAALANHQFLIRQAANPAGGPGSTQLVVQLARLPGKP